MEVRYRASFTVEATMVLGVIFLVIAVILRQAYLLHDTVTGTMILEEVLENARVDPAEDLEVEILEKRGEAMGNPRLWLGEYQMELEVNRENVYGKAMAGDWMQEMEIEVFRPGRFLRRWETIKEIGKGMSDGGN